MQTNRKVFEPFNVVALAGIIATILGLAYLLAGCATTGTPLTDKQRATAMLEIYNAEYRDTVAVMSNPASTLSQRDVGAKKKDILGQMWPLLKVYVSVVDSGGTPDKASVDQLNNLINQLTAISTGGE